MVLLIKTTDKNVVKNICYSAQNNAVFWANGYMSQMLKNDFGAN